MINFIDLLRMLFQRCIEPDCSEGSRELIIDPISCAIINGDNLKEVATRVTRPSQKSCDRILFIENQSNNVNGVNFEIAQDTLLISLVELGPHTIKDLRLKFPNSCQDANDIVDEHYQEPYINRRYLSLNVLHESEINRKKNLILATFRGIRIGGLKVYPVKSGTHIVDHATKSSS